LCKSRSAPFWCAAASFPVQPSRAPLPERPALAAPSPKKRGPDQCAPVRTAAEIAAALEGGREGRQWRCRCPIHGGRSLLVRDGDAGRILAFCHGGCETRDVLAKLRRSGLLGNPSENYQLRAMRRNDRPDEVARTARALAVWQETRPAAGTIVETYLANRGLALPPLQCLRFHPYCPHPSGRRHPAMVAASREAFARAKDRS
jgi:hypothetical protein